MRRANDNSKPGDEAFDAFHSCTACDGLKFHIKQTGPGEIEVMCEMCGCVHMQLGISR